MSVWTAPVTFVAGTSLSAATMNTEVRDHALFLKGFADLITNSTAADTGTATFLVINRAASTDAAYKAQVSGDTNNRWQVNASGDTEYGAGGAASRDLRFLRSGAGTARLDALGTATATALIVRATAGQNAVLGIEQATDSVQRVVLRGDATIGVLMSDGSATADVRWRRSAAGETTLDTNSAAQPTRLIVSSTSGQTSTVDIFVSGDSNPRFQLRGDATIAGFQAGTGAAAVDAKFERAGAATAAYWITARPIASDGGIRILAKAGAIVDGDFPAGILANGLMGYDSTNNKIMVRSGGVWKSTVALT